jgi:integration host factor subunit beta
MQHCGTLLPYENEDAEMTRADLTGEVYQAIGMPLKDSDDVVCAIFDSIVRALRSGNKVEIRGFGSFRTRQRLGRIGRNPKSGAQVEVPPKRVPFFKPSKELRGLIERLNVNL